MAARALYALLVVATLVGCERFPDKRAIALVRAYNKTKIEAYRLGDPRLVEPVAGPAEAKKLTGLIGVKYDMGHTLDAKILELKVEKVEREKEEVVVFTKERWSYVKRAVGTGKVQGPRSTDRYHMAYHLERFGKRKTWKVARIRFVTEPVVSHPQPPPRVRGSIFHGMNKAPSKEGAATQPASRPAVRPAPDSKKGARP